MNTWHVCHVRGYEREQYTVCNHLWHLPVKRRENAAVICELMNMFSNLENKDWDEGFYEHFNLVLSPHETRQIAEAALASKGKKLDGLFLQIVGKRVFECVANIGMEAPS